MSTSVEIPQAAPTSTSTSTTLPLPSGGQETFSSTAQGLDMWIENFRKYEATLQEVTKASADTKFKAELDTIEQWFKVLSEPERTASVYALLLHSNQDQIRFFISVLQQMIRPNLPQSNNETFDDQTKPKQPNRSVRPPSLNLPLPGTPATPHYNTPVTTTASASLPIRENGDLGTPANPEQLPSNPQSPSLDSTQGNEWANMVNTPLTKMFKKDETANDNDTKSTENTQSTPGLPGLPMMSPFHLNMLANAGLSTEAQLLAVQLVMSGLVQPVSAPPAQPGPRSQKKPSHLGEPKNWRTPTSGKYPASALRSGLRTTALKTASLKSAGLQSAGLQSAGLQSAGLQSSGLDSPSNMATPREEDFDPEMLNDIPAWLKSLRLHKYTSVFDGLTWQEMVVLDDATLESKGIVALGARRRLLRTFEHARKRMGMESPGSATPTTSLPPPATPHLPEVNGTKVPHSAALTSKLSINSPVFTPASAREPQSAAPVISITSPSVNV